MPLTLLLKRAVQQRFTLALLTQFFPVLQSREFRTVLSRKLFYLDTIPVPKEKMIDKFTILPVAPTFAEAIARIYNDKPFTAAFG